MHNSNKVNAAILGAGSWGIAIANHCAKIGHNVSMWEFDPQQAEKLAHDRKREAVLPGISINKKIMISSDMQKVVHNADVVFLVVPSHVVRSTVNVLATLTLPASSVIVNCAKGIEVDSLCRVSEICEQELPEDFHQRFAILSGPSHAEEVSHEIPTAVVTACKDDLVARFLQQTFTNKTFRIYRSNDIIGVELGGALKNVIAVAAGISDGAGFGDNTKAALQPRGLAEMARLGKKLGADPLTFSGLSGMGDLIVTCMSQHSRNRFVGEEIGKGKKLDQILDEMTMVAEGVKTAKAAHELAIKHNVEMPICRQVYEMLYEDKDPKSAMEDLLNREVKPEFWY